MDIVMASDGWPNSMCRLLTFCLGRAVADNALLSIEAHRKSTPATQPLQVLIQQSNIMLPFGVLMMMLLNL